MLLVLDREKVVPGTGKPRGSGDMDIPGRVQREGASLVAFPSAVAPTPVSGAGPRQASTSQ